MNNKVTLNESQLYNVIRETVKQVLREVRIVNYGMEKSVHGNDPDSWKTLELMRRQRQSDCLDKAEEATNRYNKIQARKKEIEQQYNNNPSQYFKNKEHGELMDQGAQTSLDIIKYNTLYDKNREAKKRDTLNRADLYDVEGNLK